MDARQIKHKWGFAVACCATLLLTGCSTDNTLSDTRTQLNPPVVVGEFDVVDITIEGSSLDLAGQPTVEIDEVAASFSIDTGCNTHLGSYTVVDDETFSVTLTGGTGRECDATVQLQDNLTTELLGTVDSWTSSEQNSVTLSNPEGDTIELRRQ